MTRFRFRQQEDEVPMRQIAGTGIAALAIFAIATFWAFFLMQTRIAHLLPEGPLAIPAEANHSVVGIVIHRFYDGRAWPEEREADERALERFGWQEAAQDGGPRRALIPIDRAIDLLLSSPRK